MKIIHSFVLVSVVVSLWGCGAAKAGDTCKAGEGSCETPTEGLECVNGKFVNVPCHGPAGCAVANNTATCDETLGVAGETCFGRSSAQGACATNGAATLTCQNNIWTKVTDCVTCNITTTGQVDCKQPCGPSTCSGCCFNGTCETGTADSACGKGGVTCQSCRQPGVCKATQACGVDPNSMWLVQPVSAQITPTDNGATWDALDGSAPDVFVNLACSTTAQSHTPTVDNSYTPSWSSGGCIGRASDLMTNGFGFQLWDEDISANDPVTAALGYVFTENDLLVGGVNFSANGGMQSMSVQVTKQ